MSNEYIDWSRGMNALRERGAHIVASPGRLAKGSRSREPLQLWLFGDSPVTWPQVWEWCDTHAARVGVGTWRSIYYAQHWNVPEKIRCERERAHREWVYV